MADTPKTPAREGAKTGPKTPRAKSAKPAAAVKAAPVKKAATRKAPVIEAESVEANWGSQIAPIKARAEKAAKSAREKLNAVDWKAHIEPLKEQAGRTARSAATVAKDQTGSAMQSLAKLVSETAGTVDAKLGPQYGDYARQAAETVAGAAHTLDSKDVDQLMTEARDFVRKSPAVAIGAAAVVGFVLMRLAKGSSDDA